MTAKTKKRIVIGAYILIAVVAIAVILYQLFFWRVPLLPERYIETELTRAQTELECPEVLLADEDLRWIDRFLELPEVRALDDGSEYKSAEFMLSDTDIPYHPQYDGIDFYIKVGYHGGNARIEPYFSVAVSSDELPVRSGSKGFYLSLDIPADYEGGMAAADCGDYFKMITYIGSDGRVDAWYKSSRYYYVRDNDYEKTEMGCGLINQLIAQWDAMMGI